MEIVAISRRDKDTLSIELLVDSDTDIYVGKEIFLHNESSYTTGIIASYMASKEYKWGQETGNLHIYAIVTGKKTKFN